MSVITVTYGEESPYLCLFLDDAHCDGGMTVDGHRHRGRHAKTPYLKGCDAHDDDDDEMQRFR